MDLFEIVGRFAIEGADKAESEIKSVTGTAQKSSGIFGSVGGKIAGAIGAAFATHKIIGFGKDVIATTQTFSDSMLKVQSLSGASGEELKKLNDTALHYGSTTAWTASQVADGMGYMALAGFNTNEIMSAIPGTLGLASASGTDLARASDILTDAITAFGYEAQDATKFADVLATTQAKSNTTVDALGEAFKYAGTVAGTYKYSVEDVSTALGLMANAGVKGSMAGTAFSSIVSRLGTNTKHARDTLESLGVEFFNADGTARDLGLVLTELADATSGMTVEQKANIAKTIAGQEAQKGLLAILNQGSGAYKDLNEQLKACEGSASDMSGTMESGIGGAIRTLDSAFEGFKIKLGQKFEPYIAEALQKVANFVTNTVVPAMDELFNKFDAAKAYFEEHQGLIDGMVGSLEVLAGAFTGLKVGSIIQDTVRWFQEAKLALGLFKLETHGASIMQGWLNKELTFGQTMVGLFTGQVTLAEVATGLWAKAQAILNGVMSANPIALVVMAIFAVIAIVVVLYNKCEWFRNAVNAVGNAIKDAFFAVIDWFKTLPGIISNAFSAVCDWFSGVIDTIKGGFTSFGETIKNAFTAVIDWFKSIPEAIQGIFSGVADWFGGIIDGIKNGFISFGETIQNAFTAVVDWFKSIPEAISNAFTALLDWLEQLPSRLAYVLGYGIGSVVKFAIDFGTKAKEAGINFVNNLVNFIKELPNKISTWFTNTITKVTTFVTNFVNKAKEAGINFVNNLVNFIKELPGKVWTFLTNTISKVVTFVTNFVNKAREAGINFVNNLVNFIQALPGKIATWLTNTISKVANFVSQMINKAIEAGTNFVNNVINALRALPGQIAGFFSTVIGTLTSFVSQMINKAIEAGRGFVTNIMNALRALPSQVASIGRQVVQGIWNGVTSSWSWIRGKITEWCGSFVQGFKDALNINSPSRVMRDKIGMSIGEGIGDGIMRSYSMVRGTVNTWCGNVIQSFKNALGIHSPARVTRDDVGKPLVEGIAVGIKENKDKVSKEFQRMLDDLQLQRDLDLLNDDEYYKQLETLRDTYLDKGTKDWWQYTKEIIDYENELIENEKKAFEDLNDDYEDHLKQREDLTDNFYKKLSTYPLYDTYSFTDKNGTETWYKLNDWSNALESLDFFENRIMTVQERLKNVFAGDNESLQSMLEEIRSSALTDEGVTLINTMFDATDEEFEKFASGYKKFIEKSKSITNNVYADDLNELDNSFLQKISEKFADSPILEQLKETGKGMIESLMDGIESKGEWLKEQIFDLAESVSQTFDNAFNVGGGLPFNKVNGVDTIRNYHDDYNIRASQLNQLNNINDAMDRLISLIGEYLPDISQNMDRPIIVDANSLAVGMARKMDSQLGRLTIAKGRGNV